MSTAIDATHDPARRSWVTSANAETDFPIQNLPLGIYSLHDELNRRFGVAIGGSILDVTAALKAGLLDGMAAEAARVSDGRALNDLFAAGPAYRQALRHGISDLLDATSERGKRAQTIAPTLLHAQADCQLHLPSRIGNYTDFFAGIHHARAAGAQLRPDDPLPENYKYVPIAYHGRASSVRADGGEIKRPSGQRPRGRNHAPSFGPSERLDLELEIGFYVGQGNGQGEPISIAEANGQIVGLCLLNDWSARDIQRWEMVPLGPFLSKSFATSVSPWIITVEALAPFREAIAQRPEGDPAPLPYLNHEQDQAQGAFNIALNVSLTTASMRASGQSGARIITSNARHLYWTLGQMVTHHTVNGCNLMPGDLIGTGTISGPTRAELSSLLELTFGGTEPVTLPNDEERRFLEDYDEVTFTARCAREGFVSIGFGQCKGMIIP